MHITVTGKQIDVGEALRRHAEAALEDIAEKYFGNVIESHVVFSREAHLIHTDLQMHVGRGIVVRAEDAANEAYAAFDAAIGRLGKQLRRYKRRLRDHHASAKGQARLAENLPEQSGTEQPARAYILRARDEEHPQEVDDESQPLIIAEMDTTIPHLSVSEAVMRLDLADLPALAFINPARRTLNLIYRRRDGNIGWIDPGLQRPRKRGVPS